MALYHIDLHDSADGLQERRTHRFADDDAAIDHAGEIDHPHAIRVWRRGQLVAHFPPAGFRAFHTD